MKYPNVYRTIALFQKLKTFYNFNLMIDTYSFVKHSKLNTHTRKMLLFFSQRQINIIDY